MDNKSIMETVLESAIDLEVDKITMNKLEALALPPVKQLTPRQIKSIRIKAKASQGVMAIFMNVGITTVQKWERGDTTPSGAALKLLNLAHRQGIDAII